MTASAPASDPLPAPCVHLVFEADVVVNRLTAGDPTGPASAFHAEVRVRCADCSEPFQWIGLPIGLSPREATVDVSGRELRAPLRPVSSPPGFGEDGPAFHVTAGAPL